MVNSAEIFPGCSLPQQMGKQWSCLKAKPWGALLIWSPAECHLYRNASKESFFITAALNQRTLCSPRFDPMMCSCTYLPTVLQTLVSKRNFLWIKQLFFPPPKVSGRKPCDRRYSWPEEKRLLSLIGNNCVIHLLHDSQQWSSLRYFGGAIMWMQSFDFLPMFHYPYLAKT